MKRRTFLKSAAGGVLWAPSIIRSAVFAESAPNDRINIGQIGFGRIAREHDAPMTIMHDSCRITAVADVDINRAKEGKRWIEEYYRKKTGSDKPLDVRVHRDYREMLGDKSVDAVIISTPDHWHAQPAIEAALAGKDVYLQKPASLTIEEGRRLSDALQKTGRILQIGCQQRSMRPWPQFKRVCELVRNGVIGKIRRIEVGLPTDPAGQFWPETPVPENLDYDMWLGSTERIYYAENRVHPQNDYSRPGWLRVRQFGAGMITGWGAHHVDIAHWGMGTELTGPVEMEGQAEFPKTGLWDVHGDFEVHAKYANGVTMEVNSRFTNGVRFEGDAGWIFVSRGDERATASDPVSGGAEAIKASGPELLNAQIGQNGVRLYESPEQHLDWLRCIRSREQPVSPVEAGHRACSACLLFDIAMQLPGKLYWDPKREHFIDNTEADKRIARPQRYPYGTSYIKV